MKNSKGFTLIELIMVTIILGVLAAVAVPRYMGAVSNSEEAAEASTIAALRTAVEDYATQKFLEDGRYSYPSNPFNYLEVDGYNASATSTVDLGDGEWGYWYYSNMNGIDVNRVVHKRRDDNMYQWHYSYEDLTDLDGDDRGANVGLAPENPGSSWEEYALYGDNGNDGTGMRIKSANDVESGGSGF